MSSLYTQRKSTLPVLDYIPSHWNELRGKYFLVEREDRSSDGSEDLLSVSQYTGVTKRLGQRSGSNKTRASSLKGYKSVDQDNLVINIMLAWNGSLGVSKYQGIVSPAYCVYKIGNEVFPRYLHYLVKSEEYKTLFRMCSAGVIKSRLRLYTDQLFGLRFLVPPREEQEQIARYLDHKNNLINKYIRIKKKQIELLKELKQTIINDAVTGKIDARTGKPHPKYKDSGIEWVDKIPVEWESATIRQVSYTVKTGSTPKNISEKHYDAEGILWYTPGDFTESLFLGSSSRRISRDHESELLIFPEGSVMMISIGGTIGKVSITQQPSTCNQQINAIVVSERIRPEFLTYTLRSCRDYIVATGNYTTLPIINQSSTKMLKTILPSIAEQSKIIEFITMQTIDIDQQIGNILNSINLVKELQTRLISDVVTGKLDVRGFRAPSSTVRANKFFIRSVLAAEIIDRMHKEPTFGHVKLQKTLFLCERRCDLDIGTHYHRAAAGPHDNRAIRSIDSQLQQQKWFLPIKRDQRYLYEPMENAGMHKQYYMKYFYGKHSEIDRIINLLMKLNTERCEMIATIFSAWHDLLEKDYPISEDDIINEVLYHWAESKKRIPIIRWRKCLAWMKEKQLVPILLRRKNAD